MSMDFFVIFATRYLNESEWKVHIVGPKNLGYFRLIREGERGEAL